ncbi:hypothetical protein BRADI_3g46310v3 [Brachypodium distachyon]|uniref:Cyclin n=1 Tax=Brachypodium distachyon TaxID=15368 RepID=I1IAQ2_BRADI|nr:hypothetical protein BRADI_3g46310v3 [Brachypodium distachyon]
MAASVLREDSNGSPRTLRLLASLVEAESRRFATAASEPAENDPVRAFRGGATPSVPIGEFLERLQRCFRLFDGSVYVYAGAYLTRFMRSPPACDAGIVLEPTTAHRLVSVAVLLGAKFISPRHYERRVETFEICSDRSIRASEMCPLEKLVLRAVDYRLFISVDEFQWFFRILERGPPAPESCGSRKRKAEAAAGGEEESRSVRACRPPVVGS